MKISVNAGGLQVNFADMVKDVKLIYTNVGNVPFLVEFVDPAGETKTTTVLPGERYIISSNAGNPTGGRLSFSTESGQTYMVVSKVQEDSTVDGVDEKGYLAGTASKDEVDDLQEEITNLSDEVDEVSSGLSSVKTDVTALKTKTQNQSATSGNTSLTGNLTVNGTISTGSMSDIAGNVSQNKTAISSIQADISTLTLSKLPYGTLYFNNAKLFGSNFTIPNFPFSICATVRVDSWEGSTETTQTIFQFGDSGNGALWCSICFDNIITTPRIVLRIFKNTDGTVSYSEVSYIFNKDTFLGKEHTIVGICRELESTPVNFDIYVDGAKVTTTPYKGLTLDSLSGSVNYAVNTVNGNLTSSAASANPMMLRNLCIFNFDVSAEGSPYSIADYVAGRLIPPSLIGNQFTGMYGSGWSVSGDTATCSGTSTESYPRITRGVIPSGFNFTFTVDVELAFSGTPQFEAYTTCQKAHAEIYDYSTQLTTQKDSASGGGFYGAASLGITSSGHYRIKFDCESSLARRGEMQLVIGPLTSGTIILSDTYYSRCNLALENYTIARNATTTLVKDASGNSNDATVQGDGTVAGDNDQSIKVFIDEIKTQINQANG